jgi:A/G-specific adenine glycosylase
MRNPAATNAIVQPLTAWFKHNARDLPWRRTRDPYAIWISEIMLQQTQVKTVIPYWERWMRALPTIEALASASSQRLHKLWEGLGYYTRVRNLQRAAKVIMQSHDGRFPRNFADVLELPGIGRYTAGAICSIAFNQPKPILDGNVIRVLTRLHGIDGDPRERETNALLWDLATTLVETASAHGVPASAGSPMVNQRNKKPGAPNRCSILNQALMELGALICTPKTPRCNACPVSPACAAHRQNRADQLPNLPPRAAITRRRFAAFVTEKNGCYLVQQRPEGAVNALLWEFPNLELICGNGTPLDAARHLFQTKNPQLKPIRTIKHSITRYRIDLQVFRFTATTIKPRLHGTRWLSPTQLERLPFPSAHRKILSLLAEP